MDNKPASQPSDAAKSHPDPSEEAARGQDNKNAVRFASNVEEIGTAAGQMKTESKGDGTSDLAEVTPEQIKALSNSLAGTRLAEQRMKGYSYEAFSLPASRVPSNDDSQQPTPQQSHSPMGQQSPKISPRPDIASPPLTPSGTSGPDPLPQRGARPASYHPGSGADPDAITPQASGSDPSQAAQRRKAPDRSASEEHVSQSAATTDDVDTRGHRHSMFSVGPSANSVPASRESSPSRPASQYYSRPFTPAGDANDPYAASRRAPSGRSSNNNNIDQRFVFSKTKGRRSPGSSSTSLASKPDKRHSGFLNVLNKSNNDLQASGSDATVHSRQGSMSDLRRFFKVGGHHKDKVKKTSSPSSSKLAAPPMTAQPTSSPSRSSTQVPFADDHGLTSKYGKIGRVLGSGAGGSVKLMKRSEDNTVFAVKEFRPRHTYETEKEYTKKLTAEFCVGSTLHHGNIIETLDIVQEKGKWYEVMEYAPFDLFAIVMTGKMSRAEVNCCFLQILSGVTYLHSMGLAHRDLKLDNVVVSAQGIMKIIDFGSAHVFKYPFESDIVVATGVVGSDPYLAPEVYDERKYDPQGVDIWSLAIIFCCMSLRRFPWKVPRMTDNSYKLFAAEPTPGHDPNKLIVPSRSTNDLEHTPQRDIFPEEERKSSRSSASGTTGAATGPNTTDQGSSERSQGQKEVIRGPWRLLRLLPRESRHIIGRMLTIDPKRRATMAEILEEPWVSDTVICRQLGPGQVLPAEDHTHILEPPAPAAK